MTQTTTIGQYLTQRIEDLGVKHVFGIPGDYVLGFYDLLVESPMQIMGTCDEQGAGFAADAYARVNGLGCLCVTYCVGGLKTLNPVAGAYAEKSPLIVVSGSPGMCERDKSPLLHHKVRDFRTQLDVYEKVTVASAALEDPTTAAREIDRCLAACVRYKRPVYLELPRDRVHTPIRVSEEAVYKTIKSDRNALNEAASEAAKMIKKAKRPVILAGVEVHRFGLQGSLLKFAEKTGLPIAATLLGKSVIRENHPQYLGVYEGALGREQVTRRVESADCVLIVGAFMTDINLGIYTAQLDLARTINATSERISIRHHHYDDVLLEDFIKTLSRQPLGAKRTFKMPAQRVSKPIRPQAKKPITIRRFFQRMNSFLDKDSIVIADIGDSLFGAADLMIHRRTEFLSPAYYTSMGFAVPAAVGAQIGREKLRPVVFVGDGAFQMTGQELSTVARYNLNPIIFILNNKGYTTERFIHEGPYNDVHEWAYHLLPQVFRKGWGGEVRTEGELEDALVTAKNNTTSFSLINVHLEMMDRSDALERLGKRLSQRVGGANRRTT